MAPTRITELANLIATQTTIVDNYFSTHALPTPSADIHGPTRVVIPPDEKDVVATHASVVAATQELHNLMIGPTSVVMNMSPNDLLSLHSVYRYNIASTFPVDEEASFDTISAACGLNLVDLRRLLCHAMTNQIFQEPRPGVVAHTATSRLLAEDALMRDFVGISCEERFPAAARTVDALTRYNGAHDPSQTGFSIAHSTDQGLYENLRNHPERLRRWAGAMSAFASKIPLDPLANAFDWASFAKGTTIVDVGGGYGPVSIGLASRFPDLKFIVQDFADTVKEGSRQLPQELAERITFAAYNLLDEQPIKGAAVYFFRAIFHNWPEDCCIQILRNHIPALKPGAHLVITESFYMLRILYLRTRKSVAGNCPTPTPVHVV